MSKKLSIGIMAHVDAGKTTLSEAMLYLSGQIRKLGRVDNRDSFLDGYDQERARGITIFSKQAQLKWNDRDITLLDTPGHADFSAETERALRIMDCAVLVISGTDGTQAHTDVLWSLLKRYNVPTFIFVTKMDVSHRSREELVSDLREHLSADCYAYNEIKNSLDDISVLDEEIFELYMENGTITESDLSNLIWCRKLFPVFFGSGLKLDGVTELLDGIDLLSPAIPYPNIFGAKIFKISRDTKGKRMTFVKMTGGSISVRDSINNEKITEIRVYSGQKYENAETAAAGDICAFLGLSDTKPGMGLGFECDCPDMMMEPVIGYSIIPPKGVDPVLLLPKLRQLEEEDPQLHINSNSGTGEIQLQLMGAIQTEVIRALIKERFDVEVEIGKGKVLYKETIASPVYGFGHYEPLKHYAEVQLLLEPGEPGSGITINTAISEDRLALNWQRLIFTHLEEKQHLGVLTGSPITDIRITLIDGKAHIKHTEGGDFRQATYRAVRQGLMQAESILLEPVYAFKIEVPPEHIGRAITDIHNMGGEHSSPEATAYGMQLSGKAPVSSMADYLTELLAYTGGKGRLSLRPDGYMPCVSSEKVIEEINYNPESDLENTPDSVFCSHGAGVVVKWNQLTAENHSSEELPSADLDFNVKTRTSGSEMSLDDKELEAIMEHEFGPIRRRQYSSPTIYRSAEKCKPAITKQWLIIDGYNLIFAWDKLKKIAADSIDSAREKLINDIINYCSYRGIEAILVFDAYLVPGGKSEKEDAPSLHIVYTKEGESADMYIEKFVDGIGKNENVKVVTSDAMIRLSALRAGVLRTSSREFIIEIEDCLNEMRERLR